MTRRGHRALGRVRIATAVALGCWSTAGLANTQALASTSALKKLSLDELMNVEVTSVSRTPEVLHGAAAAIAVVSAEDIKRSGATSIPEALRLVPGLHVARRNAGNWTVSARGFTSSNSEKLLVLSDTRSLYTPLFSGVFWDVQEYVLEDIERVEVIRGPGAALWGSNAVNGVINITTKSARDTHGGYLEAGAGTEEEVFTAARYGSTIGEDAHFRVFAKHGQRDESFNPNSARSDDWRLTLVGFRSDWDATAADSVTVQGSAYDGDVGQFSPSIVVSGRTGPAGDLSSQLRGGNVLARWQHRFASDSELRVRFYYDRTHRDDPSFRDDLDTYDLDLQHRFQLGWFGGSTPHEIIWGLNYRYTNNENTGKGIFALEPPSSGDDVFSAFAQDQLSLSDSVRLTIGSKVEHNDFSGTEVQPSIRASWDLSSGSTLWGAVSRAVRVPTRIERDLAVSVTAPASNPSVRLLGNDDFDSEKLLAYEAGFRWQPRADLLLDIAAFHHEYDGLVSLELGTPFIDARDGRIVIPIVNRNLTDGESVGVEMLATFVPRSNWRVTASYSYIDLTLDARGQDLNNGTLLEGATPRHQFGLRSSLDLTDALQLDVQVRTLSAIDSSAELGPGGRLAGYTELDTRLAWQASEQIEISLVGQNLLHERHAEFGSPAARGEIERSVYGKVVWTF